MWRCYPLGCLSHIIWLPVSLVDSFTSRYTPQIKYAHQMFTFYNIGMSRNILLYPVFKSKTIISTFSCDWFVQFLGSRSSAFIPELLLVELNMCTVTIKKASFRGFILFKLSLNRSLYVENYLLIIINIIIIIYFLFEFYQGCSLFLL